MFRRPFLPLVAALSVGLAACSDEPISPLVGAGVSPSESASPAHIPNRYIVVFRDRVTDVSSMARQLTAVHGGELRHTYRHALKGFSATFSTPAVEALRRNPAVAYVEADQIATLSQTNQQAATWGIDRVDQRLLPLNQTYTHVRGGEGINVYVIDSGIETTHPDFGGRASVGFDVTGGNGQDCLGHGTHVAGTIGGNTYGVAKAATLIAVRIGQCAQTTDVSYIIAGIDWVSGNRQLPAVANISLGTPASTAMDDAVRGLIASGVPTIVSAGNAGTDACLRSPARVAEAITVGATNVSDQQASFSNFGSCVDLYAPGEGITSAWLNGGTNALNGTSMATPHVTGSAVLYLQKNPGITPAQVHSGVVSNATPGRLSGLGAGSPNRLVHSLYDSEGRNRRAMHSVYHSGTGDRLYGHYPSEGYQWNYVGETVEYFHLAAGSAAGHVPLYRCNATWASSTGDHFLSTDLNCGGAANERVMGYIATSQFAGTVPLYRLYNSRTRDTMHVISSTEASSMAIVFGYQNQGIIGYVYSAP